MTALSTTWHWQVPYADTLALQEQCRTKALCENTEYLIFAEHPPTITLGKRGGTVLDARPNTAIHQIRRGGLATWHGPGQLAFYPIVNLHKRGLGVRGFVCMFEQSVIDLLKEYNINGQRSDSPGIWVRDQKIAAIGLDVRKGVNIHGVALNISTDTSVFSQIEACGDPTVEYTSICEQLCGKRPNTLSVGRRWKALFMQKLDEHGSTTNK